MAKPMSVRRLYERETGHDGVPKLDGSWAVRVPAGLRAMWDRLSSDTRRAVMLAACEGCDETAATDVRGAGVPETDAAGEVFDASGDEGV